MNAERKRAAGPREALLERHVPACVAHEHDRDEEAHGGDRGASDPDESPWRDARRECAGGKGRDRHAEVARRFVEAEREPSPSWAREVDLHQHRHRPGQALTRPEEDVRRDDEAPARRKADEQRHRQ